MVLASIGATAQVLQSFAIAEEGAELGRISFSAREEYRIYLESGEIEAAPSGRLRWSGALPAVGDWIAARRVEQGFALIESVLPRSTQFSRRAAGRAADEQVIAANIDLAVIVCGLDHDFNLRRLERYLVLGRESGAAVHIVLNKADVCPDIADKQWTVENVAGGIPVTILNAQESVEPLRAVIQGRTITFLGSSGVGKSTIVAALTGQVLATGEVRQSDSRGRHTTTGRMLIPMPGGGAVIDTPGMRELQLWASQDSLEQVFEDVTIVAQECRFRDCSHTAEPGCAVREALESGALDASRWANYAKMRAEVRHQEIQQDSRARSEEKRRGKALEKSIREHLKRKQT